MTLIQTSTLGYPRIGPNRELKFALEKFWKGAISEQELLQVAQDIELESWKLQQEMGIQHITVGDHYLYDMVLFWSESLGLCPKRFQGLAPGLPRMFAMARGVDGAEALSKYPKRRRSAFVRHSSLIWYYCPTNRHEEMDH